MDAVYHIKLTQFTHLTQRHAQFKSSPHLTSPTQYISELDIQHGTKNLEQKTNLP